MTSNPLKQKDHKLKVSYDRFLFGMIILLIVAFSFKRIPPKVYPVYKTLDEWSADLDTLTQIQVRTGYPMSKQDGDYYQAALGRLMQRLRQPIVVQIQEEQLKEKKDSVKQKNR